MSIIGTRKPIFIFPPTSDGFGESILECHLSLCHYDLSVNVTDPRVTATTASFEVRRRPAQYFRICHAPGDFPMIVSHVGKQYSLLLDDRTLKDLFPAYTAARAGGLRSPMPIGVELLGWCPPVQAGYVQWLDGAYGLEFVFCKTSISTDGRLNYDPVCRYQARQTVVHIYNDYNPSPLPWRNMPRLHMVGKTCHVYVPATYVALGLVGVTEDSDCDAT